MLDQEILNISGFLKKNDNLQKSKFKATYSFKLLECPLQINPRPNVQALPDKHFELCLSSLIVRLATMTNIAWQAHFACQVSKTFFVSHKQKCLTSICSCDGQSDKILLDRQNFKCLPNNACSFGEGLRTTVPLALTSGNPSDVCIIHPLVPVIKILKKTFGVTGTIWEKAGVSVLRDLTEKVSILSV